MLAEYPNNESSSLIMKTKSIMQQLLKAQGIEIEAASKRKTWLGTQATTMAMSSSDEDHSNSSNSSSESHDGLCFNSTALCTNLK